MLAFCSGLPWRFWIWDGLWLCILGFGMIYGYAFCKHSVGKYAAVPMGALASADFDFDPREKFWSRFAPKRSKVTPPHSSAEIRWKDYNHVVFRYVPAPTPLNLCVMWFISSCFIQWGLEFCRHLMKILKIDPSHYMFAV
jgi:hypothetical protein